MDAPKKVLVCGHVPAAQTDELFTRLASVNAKAGPFGFAFVCGGLVEPHSTGNWEAEPHLLPYIRGERAVAVPTYFCHPTLDPCMVCDNLFCLGSFGVMRLEGLNVGFLWDDAAAQVTVDCVEAADRARGIDVLITRRWPQGILNQVAAADLPPRQTYETSDAAAAVAVALGPRYIFSPGERYFERRPYVTAQHPKHATRFFALAPVGNATKDKWIYAFRLAPNECAPLPEAVMSSPFGAAPPPRRARDDEQQGFKRWADLPADAGQQGERERRKKRPNADIYEKRSGGCWFCLESPTADHHLLVSLGDLTYLALAKGGVSEDHVIVLPQEHSTAVVDLPEATTLELERYKASLTAYAASAGNKKYMFYERNVPTKYSSPHCHIQAVLLEPAHVDAVVEQLGTWQSEVLDGPFPYARLRALFERKNYFWIQLGSRLYFTTNADQVSIHFGRELYARAVGNPELVDWKSCLTDEATETQSTDRFKARFKAHDQVFK